MSHSLQQLRKGQFPQSPAPGTHSFFVVSEKADEGPDPQIPSPTRAGKKNRVDQSQLSPISQLTSREQATDIGPALACC